MPSGDTAAWKITRPILEAIAARYDESGGGGNGGGGGGSGGGCGSGRRVGVPCVCYI